MLPCVVRSGAVLLRRGSSHAAASSAGRSLPASAAAARRSTAAAASLSSLASSAPPQSSSQQPPSWLRRALMLGLSAAVTGAVGLSTAAAAAEAAPAAAAASAAAPAAASAAASGISDDGIYLHKLLTPSTGKPLLVLVACGSYSPITNMHLLVFEQARNYLMFEQSRYDVIGGWISPVHDAYGKKSLIAQQHRFRMCEAATASSVWLSVQEWEMKQTGWTTTAEVLCKYQQAINKAHLAEETIRVKMLCGADLLESTLVPDLWAKEDLDLIFGTLGVVVIERVGLNLETLIQSNEILRKYKDNIDIVPQRITNTISSTSVRDLIKKQESVRYLTPDPVIDYIYKNALYGHNPAAHPPKPTYLEPRD